MPLFLQKAYFVLSHSLHIVDQSALKFVRLHIEFVKKPVFGFERFGSLFEEPGLIDSLECRRKTCPDPLPETRSRLSPVLTQVEGFFSLW